MTHEQGRIWTDLLSEVRLNPTGENLEKLRNELDIFIFNNQVTEFEIKVCQAEIQEETNRVLKN